MRRTKVKNSGYLPALFILLILAGCQPKTGQSKAEEAMPVKVMKVQLQEINEILEYVGNIHAQEEAVIYPKVTGKIIEKVKEDGSAISKGQAIVYIDRDEVGLKFEKAPVESTLNGVVGRVYVDIGQNVSPQTAIAFVVDMDKMKIDLDVPEKYLSKVAIGQEARIYVDAYPEETFNGKVSKISPVVDLSTRSAPIEIMIGNPEHKLKSGMFARVNLLVNGHKRLPVILKEALIGKEPDVYVYTVENKKAALKKITLGLRQGPNYAVLEGLNEGDLVVIMGQQRLSQGAEVYTEEEK